MWFRSFSLLSQSSFDSSIVQNTSNIKFFISPQKKDTNQKNILPFNTNQMKENFFLKINLVSGKIAQSEDKVWVHQAVCVFRQSATRVENRQARVNM